MPRRQQGTRKRRSFVAPALFTPAVLAGCSDVPSCKYLPPPQAPESGIIGFPADQSQMAMLPYNPYWVSSDPSLPVIGASDEACAGQPWRPGRLP